MVGEKMTLNMNLGTYKALLVVTVREHNESGKLKMRVASDL